MGEEGIQRADSDTGELGEPLLESTESLKGEGGVKATNSSSSGLVTAGGASVEGPSLMLPQDGFLPDCDAPFTSMAGRGWISAKVVMVVGSWISLGIK